MEETNSIFATAWSIIGATIANFYSHLAPWLLLGVVLVFVDLRFGVLAAKKRGERIRTSRAWRRTINKMVDYLCWVTLAERVFPDVRGVAWRAGGKSRRAFHHLRHRDFIVR